MLSRHAALVLFVIACRLTCFGLSTCHAQAVGDFIDFDTEIVPILSQAGCNAAACHGGAAGRGGFRLSLFGGDPEFDYRSIVLELEGRRINHRRPEESLLLAKPTEVLEHGGGERLDYDGPRAATIRTWISQGARRRRLRQLRELRIQPTALTVEQSPSHVQVQVHAHFDDGTRRDVTELAVYAVDDRASLEVSVAGRVAVSRPGRHLLLIRFADQIATLQITAPYSVELNEPAEPTDPAWKRNNWIDDEIHRTLRSLRIPPSPQADETTILRRLHLDLTGRLPAPREVEQFLADDLPDKTERLIDRLLDGDEFVEYWTYRLARLLRTRVAANDAQAAACFRQWLTQRVRDDAPWDATVRQLLTAEGDTHVVGPANLHRLVASAREQAEYVSEVFMGVSLRCANCHNHPLDAWKQDDYHGLAQLFARLQRGPVVRWGRTGEVTHPATGRAAVARIPDGTSIDDLEQGRARLAAWLTEPDNAYFAPALVNRLWQALLGRGLVDPPHDMRATNPSSHPELLNRLADHFRVNGYRLRPTLRLICQSAVYARARRATADNAHDQRFYSHALPRTMPAEVWADALSDVLDVDFAYGDLPVGTRAVSLVDPQTPSAALDALGRCDPAQPCAAGDFSVSGMAAQLGMLNGPLINRGLADDDGRLARLMRDGRSDESIYREFSLRALGRPPTSEESAWWVDQQQPQPTPEQRRAVLEDAVWSLLTSYDFVHID